MHKLKYCDALGVQFVFFFAAQRMCEWATNNQLDSFSGATEKEAKTWINQEGLKKPVPTDSDSEDDNDKQQSAAAVTMSRVSKGNEAPASVAETEAGGKTSKANRR